MSRSVVRRLLLTIAPTLVAAASVPTIARAQGTDPARADSAVQAALPHKSAAVAGLPATIIPESAYAGEGRRGLIAVGGMAGLISDSRAATLTRLPVTMGMTRRPTASGHDVRAIKVGMRFALR